MNTGVVHIRECIYCKHHIAELLPGEENDSQAKFYSDGKSVGIHNPTNVLVSCQCCREYLWLQTAPILARSTYHYWTERSWLRISLPSHLTHAQVPNELTIDELVHVVRSQFMSKPADELFLRQQICWRFNDRVRNDSAMFLRPQEWAIWMENTKALLDLLDPKEPLQLVMMAELFRYLGDFNRAAQVIQCVDLPDYQWTVPLYLKRCKDKNTDVFLLGEYVKKEFVINAS
ncbi:hypothetical protein PBT90_08520 [Algoriphagus halophytocola]|uniref:CpXC domain-containing protein n=1 Tax=Algoriphagus halophytocola TaxID=2991499 RepID=A0ABY6MKD8_9BACT|nr:MULTISPECIES: hypothetical protein [unclassified Algoriphagus]UZD23429.1 hypothetical protein OM944_02835 [Algoriphagus sp. TR-M5]WBL44724.1 hypothetical protein PBT90_08520 [Algoriphagus sp. TR-M9]